MRIVSFCKCTKYRHIYYFVFIIFLCLNSNLLADNSTNGGKLTIAVVDLDNMKGVDKEDAVFLSERLRNELYETGKYVVVERKQMEKILSEQGFSLTGCVDNMCYVKAGQILGVSLIVVGSVGKIEGMYSITTRIVDVETAEYRNTATLDIDSDIRGLLTDGMRYIAYKLAGDDPRMPESGRKPANKYSQTNHSNDDKDTYLYISFFPGYTGCSKDTIYDAHTHPPDREDRIRYTLASGLTFNFAFGVSFKKISIELGSCYSAAQSTFIEDSFVGGLQEGSITYDDNAGISAVWLIGKYNLITDRGFTPYVTFGPLVAGGGSLTHSQFGFNLGAGFKIPVTRRLTINLEANFFIVPGDEFGGTTIYNIKFTPEYAIKFY
jgi:TolB-like protein/opacity protein-like surface antigen